MGQCYIIEMDVRYPEANKEKIISTLSKYILDKQANSLAEFHLDEYAAKGYTPDTWEGVMTLLFTDRGAEISAHHVSAGFDASYGWEYIMVDAFKSIAHLLDDSSRLIMHADNEEYTYTIQKGKMV